MTGKYSTGVRFNHQMGMLETLSFAGEGIGAGLFVAGVLTGQVLLVMVGIAAVLVAVVALLAHLGRPLRSWRAMTRLATSGVSRGTAVISGFLGCALGAQFAGLIGLPAGLQQLLTIGALLFALPVTIYAGMLLRSMKAIRLWRGPLVPLAFISHSLASAATLAAWLGAASTQGRHFQIVALIGLLFAAVMSGAHLLRAQPSEGVRASLERLLRGDLSGRFLVGAGLVGLVVPLAAVALAGMTGAGVLLLIAAVARVYGDFAYRNAIVMAGAYEPIMPQGSQRPLGASLA